MSDDSSSGEINKEYENFFYEYRHASGKNYYYNIGSHETTWFYPENGIILHPKTKRIINQKAETPVTGAKPPKEEPVKESHHSHDSQATQEKSKAETEPKTKTETQSISNFFIPDHLKEDSENTERTADKLCDSIFQKSKKGVPTNSFKFQDTPITASLLDLSNSADKKASKTAYPLFKSILKNTNLRESKECTGTNESIVEIIEKSAQCEPNGINSPFLSWNKPFGDGDNYHFNLVDEVYAQLIKQTNECPPNHLLKNLELLNIIINCFQPSQKIQQTLLCHLARLANSFSENDERLKEYSIWCYIQLFNQIHGALPILNSTASEPYRYITPSYIESLSKEIDRDTRVFDISLIEIMFHQRKTHPNCPVPYIMHQFCEILFELGCENVTGIFRIPGNLTKIEEYIQIINNGDVEFLKKEKIEDVASLFKLWIRRIAGAIINKPLTEELVNLKGQDSFLEFVNRFDEANKRFLMYLVGFLKRLSLSSSKTNMDVNNLAMVFGPNIAFPADDSDPMANGKISSKGQTLLATLMNNYDVSSVYPYTE